MFDVEAVSPKLGHYLAGFADGEGSFNVSFRKRDDYKGVPWKVSACFNVSQRDEEILRVFKRTLRCGTLRSRRDGVWYFEVNSLGDIKDNVIPFFERFGFLSHKKQRDFLKFVEIVRLMLGGHHLDARGIERILEIRRDMNDGGARRRKYSEESIRRRLRESPEAIR